MKEQTLPSGLYLVATPIGNKLDISLRAIEVLKQVDIVACEDTRVTRKLCSLLGIKVKYFLSYHDHNAHKIGEELVAKLEQGMRIALVSDAGMPLISDPGFPLIRLCIEHNIPITSIPGASAALTALQLSGLPCERFFFAGFLPSKTLARQKELQELEKIPSSLIFYESPNRLLNSLQDMHDVLGNRSVAVARELTKMFEEVRRGTLSELIEYYQDREKPKGEIVIILAPPLPEKEKTQEEIDAMLEIELKKSSAKQASKDLAEKLGLKKRDLYQRALELKVIN